MRGRHVIIETDTHSIVEEKVPKGKTACLPCPRLCHGVIYRTAKELGTNKTTLGHHCDNIVSTLFLNMFFGSKMKSMPLELATGSGDHIVIRSLAYCVEKNIASYVRAVELPIIPCNLCGPQENLQCKKVKGMLLEWERQTPGRTDNVFASLRNVVPSHLAGTDLFDFNGLTTGLAEIGKDALFDQTAYDQIPLVFAGSHDDRVELVRFEHKPGDKSAE